MRRNFQKTYEFSRAKELTAENFKRVFDRFNKTGIFYSKFQLLLLPLYCRNPPFKWPDNWFVWNSKIVSKLNCGMYAAGQHALTDGHSLLSHAWSRLQHSSTVTRTLHYLVRGTHALDAEATAAQCRPLVAATRHDVQQVCMRFSNNYAHVRPAPITLICTTAQSLETRI